MAVRVKQKTIKFVKCDFLQHRWIELNIFRNILLQYILIDIINTIYCINALN